GRRPAPRVRWPWPRSRLPDALLSSSRLPARLLPDFARGAFSSGAASRLLQDGAGRLRRGSSARAARRDLGPHDVVELAELDDGLGHAGVHEALAEGGAAEHLLER